MCKGDPNPQKLQSTLDSYAYLGICVGTGSSLIHIDYSEDWYQDSVVLMTSSYELDKTPPIRFLQSQQVCCLSQPNMRVYGSRKG